MSTIRYETALFLPKISSRWQTTWRGRLAATPKTIGLGGLSWRCLAVSKNFRNRRRKFINARARHDDAIAAAVCFLSDTQEPASLVFTELDVEVLALDLQFSRLDDVVHFALRAPSLGVRSVKWKQNPRALREFLMRHLPGGHRHLSPRHNAGRGCPASRST
jgi:hypothetical protein